MNVFIKPEIANAYDAYYQSEAGKEVNEIEEKLIAAALKLVPKGKMLELGCGTGHWTKFFSEKDFNLTACDVSDAMLKHARQKALNVEILKADSEDLPFEKESFGVISSVTMMEFVNDQNKVLEEIYRVLEPKGYLILACLNGNSRLMAALSTSFLSFAFLILKSFFTSLFFVRLNEKAFPIVSSRNLGLRKQKECII